MPRTRSPGAPPHDARNRRQRELIDTRMHECGIDTIAQLEDMAGVKRDKVRHFLKGYTKSLNSNAMQAICAVLGIPVYDFVGGPDTGCAREQFVFHVDDVSESPPAVKSLGKIGISIPAKFGMPGNGNLGAWVVAGDSSMSPVIAKGDFVWVDWRDAFNGAGIYLLRGAAKTAPTLLRRVTPHGIGGKVDVTAENARHGGQSNISLSALRFLGRATHTIKKI
ncbi:MAG: helix-turn-helix domain-containing protein [Parvibaculum sp.]|nr:helix-turn-helix domain-containing protein [Parvibaculum sp.]